MVDDSGRSDSLNNSVLSTGGLGLSGFNLAAVDSGTVLLGNLLPNLAVAHDEVDVDDIENLVESVSAGTWVVGNTRVGTSVSADGLGLRLLGLEDDNSVLELGEAGSSSLKLGDELRLRSSLDFNFALDDFDFLSDCLSSLGATLDLDVVSVDNDSSLNGDSFNVNESLDVLSSSSLNLSQVVVLLSNEVLNLNSMSLEDSVKSVTFALFALDNNDFLLSGSASLND